MNFGSQTASSLLAQSRSTSSRFSSGSSIDALLSPINSNPNARRGLAKGSVLELMGPPGAGRTKTALAFAMNTRFGSTSDESEEVLIVDAEGSLSPTMIRNTADAFSLQNSRLPHEAEVACDGIHYKRVLEASVLHAFLLTLSNWLDAHPRVRLIIIDSLSSHFRPTNHDVSMKTILHALVKSTLAKVTATYAVSVIITTQLSVKLFTPDGEISKFGKNAEALLVPQLGDAWIPGHFWRIILYFDLDGNRLARLMDSHAPSQSNSARFGINDAGPYTLP